MHGFTQYTPTRIIFGKETQKQAGELAKSLKASKVFVVYGGGSVVRSGLLDEVTASLEEAGLEYMTVGGVKPNPRLSFAREAVKKSIEFGTDFVLAVGGYLQKGGKGNEGNLSTNSRRSSGLRGKHRIRAYQ